jgi:hypothetical protein
MEDNVLSPDGSPTKPTDEKQEPTYYRTQMAMKNIWIIKPGENTNRGQGI